MKETLDTVLEIDGTSDSLDGAPAGVQEPMAADASKARPSGNPTAAGAPVIGRLAAIRDGIPMVDFAGNSADSPLAARSTMVLRETDVGREIVLIFEQGELHRPIVVGLIQNPEQESRVSSTSAGTNSKKARVVELDGETVILSAEQEIVLRCGEASITLTRAGKILIRGAYLLSRSSGINRIKGAAVEIN